MPNKKGGLELDSFAVNHLSANQDPLMINSQRYGVPMYFAARLVLITHRKILRAILGGLLAGAWSANYALAGDTPMGQEKAITRHLQDGEEYHLPIAELIAHGERLFKANWTREDGAGRPVTKGNGAPLADRAHPLRFPRDMNRIAGPDTNSCAGCHNVPRVGGGGDFAANAFVLAQRFDFASFDPADDPKTKGLRDETGHPTTLQSIGNSRNTLEAVRKLPSQANCLSIIRVMAM